MKYYYVYILLCADNSYYTGVTDDLERRVNEHKEGNDLWAYTYGRRPVELKFFQQFQDIKEAISFEKQIKGWTRAKKEALIEKNWNRLKELAVCKNATNHKNKDK
jgi:putative endonuclease